MQAQWALQLAEERRRELLARREASRRVGRARPACRSGAVSHGARPPMRTTLGWWMVDAGLRLAVAPRASR